MRPRRLISALVLSAVIGANAHPVSALQYERLPVDDGDALILARGAIVKGDTERFRQFLTSMQARGDNVIGVALDSPGGALIEAETLAGKIRQENFGVLVPRGSECSSSCFLLFAAARRRLVGSDALIGIHSASEGGEETPYSMGMTTALARDLGAYGVPNAIVGKLVQTEPGRTTWLLPSDLASMDVKVLPDKSKALESNTPPLINRTPNVPPTEQRQARSAAYEEGLVARRSMETWFANLTGDYRAGADYWTAQRSLPKSGSCYTPPTQYSKGWTDGCLEAQRRFAPNDVRRKSEPEFKQGWNSY